MNKIIVAPSLYKKNLLNYLRQKNAFANPLIVSKEEIQDAYFGKAKDSALVYLIKEKGLNYEIASLYLKNIPFAIDCDNQKIKSLYLLKEELIQQGLFYYDEALIYALKNQAIDIYDYFEDDVELNYLINKLQISPTYCNNPETQINGVVFQFASQDSEVLAVLNAIAGELQAGHSCSNIKLMCCDDSYFYYLNLFSKSFGFNVNLENQNTYFSTGICLEFLNLYTETKDLPTAIIRLKDEVKDDDLLPEFISLINLFTYPELSFEQQYDLLIGEFKTKTFSSPKYDQAIEIINKPTFLKNNIIHVLGFAQGIFPNVRKDNDYFNDAEKSLLNLNSSQSNTTLSTKSFISFFSSLNTFNFSYSKLSLDKTFYISPLSDYLGLGKADWVLPDKLFSQLMVDYFYALACDEYYLYKKKTTDFVSLNKLSTIDYNTYTNVYTTVPVFNDTDKITYSYSQIKMFYECPFKFYLSKVLEVDSFEPTFNAHLGVIAHEVLEHQFDDDFDFDSCFDTAAQKLTFTKKELVFLNLCKKQIKEAVLASKMMKSYSINPQFFKEKKVNIPINNNSYLFGVIDKAVICDDAYFYLVDYKTNNEKFDPKFLDHGISLQLPTYALLASCDPDFENYQLGGLYINNILQSSNKSEPLKEDQLIQSSLKLNGKTITDTGIISKIDSTFADGVSSFINGVRLKKDGFLASSPALVSNDEIKSYIEKARKLYLDADKKIRKNEFLISPYYITSDNNGCKYCPFNDICFKRYEQIKKIGDEVDGNEND